MLETPGHGAQGWRESIHVLGRLDWGFSVSRLEAPGHQTCEGESDGVPGPGVSLYYVE